MHAHALTHLTTIFCAAQVCSSHEDQGAAGLGRQLHQAAATVRAGPLRTGAAADAYNGGSNNTRPRAPMGARSEYRPAADGAVWSRAMLACVHHATRTHDSGAADRSGAGYVCADAGRLTCAGMRLRARSRRCRARGSGRSCKSCACRRLARIVRRTADGIHARARDPRRARCESK